jgi:hypothetical protein
MRHVEIELPVPGRDAVAVYTALCAFERFPEQSRALRSLRVAHSGDGRLWSRWELLVQGAVLRWTEQDRFDRRGLAIRFRQTDGDPARFAGAWRVAPTPNGCAVRFVADLDLGPATLAGLIEPMVERALRGAVQAIVVGLFGAPIHPSRARRARPTAATRAAARRTRHWPHPHARPEARGALSAPASPTADHAAPDASTFVRTEAEEQA